MLRPEGTFVGQALLDGGSMHLTAGNMSAIDVLSRVYEEGLVDKNLTTECHSEQDNHKSR